MSETGAYVTIVTVLLLGAISPGPSFVVVARTSLSSSRAAGLRVALGLGLGGLVYALLALAGLIALLAAVEWLFTMLKLAGAAYLLYLAVRLWTHARDAIGPTEPHRTVRSDVVRGLVVQLSNPKTAVVYASVCRGASLFTVTRADLGARAQRVRPRGGVVRPRCSRIFVRASARALRGCQGLDRPRGSRGARCPRRPTCAHHGEPQLVAQSGDSSYSPARHRRRPPSFKAMI